MEIEWKEIHPCFVLRGGLILSQSFSGVVLINKLNKKNIIKKINQLLLLASLRVEKTITGCSGTLSPLDYKDYGFEQNADITKIY